MSLIKRTCPLCAADSYKILIVLEERYFTKVNPSYRLDRIHELGLDPDQRYPIVLCRRCGMIYSLYKLDDERESIVYNRIIDTEVSRSKVLKIGRKLSDLKRWQNLTALTYSKKNTEFNIKLLDYGCGWGTLLLTAKRAGVEVKSSVPQPQP